MKQGCEGFTLAEIVLGGMLLSIALAAILGSYVGEVTLNEHARNLSLAIQDANRVIEQIRQNNAACSPNPPLAQWPSGASWDGWLNDPAAGGGKSLQPDPTNNELVVVTCQAQAGGAPVDCTAAGPDPLRVTVAVCWRHRGRIIGECAANGAALQPDETVSVPNEDLDIIQSPAMLTTLVTCRS